MITTDAQNRIVYLNQVAEDMTGWTLYEASDQPLTEIFQLFNEIFPESGSGPGRLGAPTKYFREGGRPRHSSASPRSRIFFGIDSGLRGEKGWPCDPFPRRLGEAHFPESGHPSGPLRPLDGSPQPGIVSGPLGPLLPIDRSRPQARISSRFFTWISTISRRSTTEWDIRSATAC